MKIVVSRAALKLFLELWKKELFANYDKAERVAGLKNVIDHIPLPVLRAEAFKSGPEFIEFEVPIPE